MTGCARFDPLHEGEPHVVDEVSWDGVQLVLAPASRWPGLADRFRPQLSAEEKRRAERFHRDQDRLRFVVGRGLVRLALGTLLDRPASAVALSAEPGGKPRCAQVDGAGLAFSLSHCDTYVVVGVARRRAMGVDVERLLGGKGMSLLAHRICTPGEWRLLAACPQDRRGLACTALWTRKEAVLKGIGCGLRRDVRSVDVLSATVEGWQVRSGLLGATHVVSTAVRPEIQA